MTITIASMQSVCVFILTCVGVLTLFATLHWKLFVDPMFRKLIEPMVLNVLISSRLLREKYPEDYDRIEREVIQEMKLRGVA